MLRSGVLIELRDFACRAERNTKMWHVSRFMEATKLSEHRILWQKVSKVMRTKGALVVATAATFALLPDVFSQQKMKLGWSFGQVDMVANFGDTAIL